MGRVHQRHRVARLARRGGRRLPGGFTLVEVLIVMFLLGAFLIMIGNLLVSSVRMADQRRQASTRRAGNRFAMSLLTSEVAGAGARLPTNASYYAPDTLNNVNDPDRADVGSDTIGILRSRTGDLTAVIGAGNPMKLLFHTQDTVICETKAKCIAAFSQQHGEKGDYFLVWRGQSFWLLQIKDIKANLPTDIEVKYDVIHKSGFMLAIQAGDQATGVIARNFRVKDGNLEMQEGIYDAKEEFFVLAQDVEDMQVAFLMQDGSYQKTGLPAEPENIRGTAVSLVSIAPEDRNLGGNIFVRPALEDHDAGLLKDRRRRSVMREIIWGRNMGLSQDT